MNTQNCDTLLLTEVQKGASNSIAILRLLTNEHFIEACSLQGLEAALTNIADAGELPLTHSTLRKAIEKRRQKRAEIDALIDRVKQLSVLKELILQHLETENRSTADIPAAIMPKEDTAGSSGSNLAPGYPTAEDKELAAAVQAADGLLIAKLLLNKAFMSRCSAEGISQIQQKLQQSSPYPTLLTLLHPYSTTTNS